MKDCEDCKRNEERAKNRIAIRKWATEKKVEIHKTYMNAVTCLNTIYSRPHKYCIYSANKELLKSLEIK